MKNRRVFLKLSGEALAGPKKTGFDEDTVNEVARQVKASVDAGVQVGVVIGGGNFWRGRTSDAIDRPKADQIGMLATVMNCIYVSEIFRNAGMKTQILTPFECGNMTKLFSKDRANKYFEHGMVVFFAGGIGQPYFSSVQICLETWHGVRMQGSRRQNHQNPRFETQPRFFTYQHGLFRRFHRQSCGTRKCGNHLSVRAPVSYCAEGNGR